MDGKEGKHRNCKHLCCVLALTRPTGRHLLLVASLALLASSQPFEEADHAVTVRLVRTRPHLDARAARCVRKARMACVHAAQQLTNVSFATPGLRRHPEVTREPIVSRVGLEGS